MERETDEGDMTEPSERAEEVRPVRLSLHLIVKRHLPKEAETWNQEQVLESLNKITHLRLDRENISTIDSLELLGSSVTNVYLQQNRITAISNLDCLPSLQFLTLAGNGIRTVENLQHLHRLLFLDLSDNAIEDFDIDEFPQSVIILDLRGNPCCNKPDYRGSIVQELANLKQLDGEEVSKLEKLEVGFQISSEEEGDEEVDEQEEYDWRDKEDGGWEAGGGRDPAEARPTVLGAYTTKLPDIETRLQDLTTEILLRSQNRLEDTLQVHRRRVMEMRNIRIKNKTLKHAGRSSAPK
ncbi:leucine-rich repeat-containing protein 46-like [Babylonia areolata]|uniref:leucine-rich repeat-containing protein 46-like n=1 Tax=Babylonia areolata TaxID=304850 RepID=UPI003FD0695D